MTSYRFIYFALLTLAFAPSSFGFCPQLSSNLRNVATFVSDESSSDTSSIEREQSDVVTIKSEEVTSKAESVVSAVLDSIPFTLGEVSEADRSMINEVLLRLEALNPAIEPARSPSLNGEWELRYSGGFTTEGALMSPTRQIALFLYSGGYSPGLFALSLAQKLPKSLVSVGEMKIDICEEQPRIQATVDLKSPFGDSTVVVKARLMPESDIRLRETYESAEVMGRNVELPEFLQYSRELYVTYVDEDLLVVRNGSGIPELLVRPTKTTRM
eukprot:scaffold91_cov127-Cylindrotheca_fusiformis.AAC.2